MGTQILQSSSHLFKLHMLIIVCLYLEKDLGWNLTYNCCNPVATLMCQHF